VELSPAFVLTHVRMDKGGFFMEKNTWFAALSESFTPLLQGILEHLPGLLSFLGLILFGWILARLLQSWTVRLVGGLDQLVHSRTIRNELKESRIGESAPKVIGRIVFWIILVFFIAAATEALGVSVVSGLLGRVAYYLPNVLAAVLIVLAGLLGGNLSRKAISRATGAAGIVYGELLARASQALILSITVLIAIEQIGIDIKFLTILIAIMVGTTLSGMALAFGLGSTMFVSNIIASHYLLRAYEVGHTVRIGDVEGRIIEVTFGSVLLDTPGGRMMIPAREFFDKHSVLITGGG
jgi:hypothetical protein